MTSPSAPERAGRVPTTEVAPNASVVGERLWFGLDLASGPDRSVEVLFHLGADGRTRIVGFTDTAQSGSDLGRGRVQQHGSVTTKDGERNHG